MGKQSVSKSAEYAAMVAEAEASVGAVKDPELRRVAFEKILVTLLEDGLSKSEAPSYSAKKERATKVTKIKSKGSAARATRQGPQGRIQGMIDEGFFKKQRTIAEVKAELANRGHHIPLNELSLPLQRLTQKRQLRRQKVSANGKGSKAAFAYSNW